MKRRSWSLPITLALVLIATTAMAGPRQMKLHQRDADHTIQLAPDTVAVIELESQPATGHGWRVSKPLDSKLKIVGSEFEPSPSGLLGGWVTEKIYVVAAGQGAADLHLQYRRAFEQSSSAELKFRFQAQGRFTESFTLPAAEEESLAPTQEDDLSTSLTALPNSFNWCDQNGCTPIKDQGNCGSCWAFATVGPLESLIKINDGATVNLSEQYLVSCNDEGWGCDGGFWAHDYHQWKTVSGETEAGAVLESNFPYQAYDAACNPPHAKSHQLDSWEYVCPNCTPTTAQIKQAIYDHGPLSVGVCVNSAFQNYSGGVFSGPSCSSLNHGVVLVGWDDSDSCWIMRNSWGAGWGEAGYMRIQYGVSGIGDYAAYVSYGDAPTPDPDPDPDPDPEDGEITNGQIISDLAASRGEWLDYYINVPGNASNLQVRIYGGSGDADLYTLFGAAPTTTNYDCRPYIDGNNETCDFPTPEAGTWYIGLRGYTAFSGVSLTASYEDNSSDPDPEPDPKPVTQCITANNLAHINQGRAYRCGWWGACASGSGESLGLAWSIIVSSLEETSTDYWEKTDSCP